jgi:hypothetical protein
VHESRIQAGLTGANDTTRAGGEGEEKTGAECKEERSADDEVVASEDETHRAGDERVHEEEDQSMEEHSHLTGFAVSERNLGAVGGQNNTGAQGQKKSGRDGDLLRRKVWEHLIYTHIIFGKVRKVVKGYTSHHLLVKMVIINISPEVSPYVRESLLKPLRLFLIFPCDSIMF